MHHEKPGAVDSSLKNTLVLYDSAFWDWSWLLQAVFEEIMVPMAARDFL